MAKKKITVWRGGRKLTGDAAKAAIDAVKPESKKPAVTEKPKEKPKE